jgi:dCMP deaminase
MNWDKHFMDHARGAATWSTDRSTKVGCAIVGPGNVLLVSDCNSFPEGVRDVEVRHQRPAKYKWTEHAERNAIYRAARRGISTEGCHMYLPWFPCMDCARAIVQAGITELVCHSPNLDDPTWGADFRDALVLFAETGTAVRFVCPKQECEQRSGLCEDCPER